MCCSGSTNGAGCLASQTDLAQQSGAGDLEEIVVKSVG